MITYRNNFAGDVDGATPGWGRMVGTGTYAIASNAFIDSTPADANVGICLSAANTSNDFDITISQTFGDLRSYGIIFRATDAFTNGYLLLFDTNVAYLFSRVSSSYAQLLVISPTTGWVNGDTIHARILAVGSSIQVKIWLNSAGEPGAWLSSSTQTAVSSGTRFGFYTAKHAGGVASGAVTSIAVSDPTATSAFIDFTDASLVYSPWNWEVRGNNRIQTANPGAYIKTNISGTTSLAVSIDAYSFLAAGCQAKLAAEIDGVLQSPVTVSASTVTLATGLSTALHTVKIWLYLDQETFDRWNGTQDPQGPDSAIRLRGLILDSGGTTSAPTPFAKNQLSINDSIGEGVYANGIADYVTGNNATSTYPQLVAQSQGYECGMLGFGRTGWITTGNGNVPIVGSFWANFMNGRSRLVGGKLSPVPDRVLINEGVNDGSGNITSAAIAALTAIRAAVNPTTPIYVMIPISEAEKANIVSVVTALADPYTKIVDNGTRGATIVANNSADGLHPNPTGHALEAVFLEPQITQSTYADLSGLTILAIQSGLATETNATTNKNTIVTAVGSATTAATSAATSAGTAATQATSAASGIANVSNANGTIKLPATANQTLSDLGNMTVNAGTANAALSAGALALAPSTGLNTDQANKLNVIYANTGSIIAGKVTVRSPVVSVGNLTLIQGNDYNTATNQPLLWTDVGGNWPDLTSATIAFLINPTPCGATGITGSVIVPSGSGKQVQVQLSATYTAALAPGVGAYSFAVVAKLTDGSVCSLVIGTLNVVGNP